MSGGTTTTTDVIDALVDYMRESKALSYPRACTIVLNRLFDVYGQKLVMRAAHRYAGKLRRERRRLERLGRAEERQRRQNAAWLKREGSKRQ